MSPDIIILLLGLVALMALGIPICFAMMSVASVILLVFYGSGLLNVLNAAFVYQMQSESLLAIPMFALMAAFLQTSGIGGDIYEFFHKWLVGINGGLAMATVATTAVIAAMSGVAATATIMMGLIALPAMLDRGYDKALATGPVLAGGCLGPIIPPSTIMIIMSSYTGVSAGWLFAGGALPGVGLALLFIIYIGIRCAINPKLGPGIPKAERPSWGEKMRVFKKVIAPIAIIVLVLGCIYAGIATPTEAAGVGAFASMVYALITRKLNVKNLRASLIQTMEVSAMLMWILMGGAAYNSLVNITRLSDVVAAAFASSNLDGLPLMLLIFALFFVMGMFLDTTPIIMIAIPIHSAAGNPGFFPGHQRHHPDSVCHSLPGHDYSAFWHQYVLLAGCGTSGSGHQGYVQGGHAVCYYFPGCLLLYDALPGTDCHLPERCDGILIWKNIGAAKTQGPFRLIHAMWC